MTTAGWECQGVANVQGRIVKCWYTPQSVIKLKLLFVGVDRQ